jgi:hypothetical protein
VEVVGQSLILFFVKSPTVCYGDGGAQRRQQVALTGTINLVAVVVSSYFSLALDSNQGLA